MSLAPHRLRSTCLSKLSLIAHDRGPATDQRVLKVQHPAIQHPGRAEKGSGEQFAVSRRTNAQLIRAYAYTQEEKELYDDLEMELELADEKEPVP